MYLSMFWTVADLGVQGYLLGRSGAFRLTKGNSDMEEFGLRNPGRGIETTGLANLSSLRWNLTEGELVETAVRRAKAS